MKVKLFIAAVIVCAVGTLAAQNDESAALRREHWDAAVFAGGGTGVGSRTDVQFARAGVRVGRVMTGELGRGWARGTFEMDAEFTPVDYVLWSGYKNVYGFGVTPLMMKWNFTSGRRTVPFVSASGSYLHTIDNVPPGDTSKHNFISGVGFGMHHFVRPQRAITWDVRAVHLSNASIGRHNPGVNASVQFSLGYSWFQR